MILKATVILWKMYAKTYKGKGIWFLSDFWDFLIESVGMSALKFSTFWELGYNLTMNYINLYNLLWKLESVNIQWQNLGMVYSYLVYTDWFTFLLKGSCYLFSMQATY